MSGLSRVFDISVVDAVSDDLFEVVRDIDSLRACRSLATVTLSTVQEHSPSGPDSGHLVLWSPKFGHQVLCFFDTWSFGHLVLFLTAWMGPPRYRIPGFQELHSTYRDVLWLVRISEKNLLHIRNIFCVGDPSRILFRKKKVSGPDGECSTDSTCTSIAPKSSSVTFTQTFN